MEIRKNRSGQTEVKVRGAWTKPLEEGSIRRDMLERDVAQGKKAGTMAGGSELATRALLDQNKRNVNGDKSAMQPTQPAPPQGPIDINTRGIKPLGEAQPQSNLRTLTDGILGVSSPEPLEMPVFADMADNYQDVEMPEAIDLGALSINRLGTSDLGIKAEQDQIMSGFGGTDSLDTLINGLNDSLKRRVQ
jgi:hypothetical protein